MSERDDLADLLTKHEDCAFSASGVLVCTCGTAMQPNEAQWDLANLAGHQADTLLAAGYRRPRTVTSLADLDALPVGSVLNTDTGAWEKVSDPDDEDDITFWLQAGNRRWNPARDVPLPATVLHEPEAAE